MSRFRVLLGGGLRMGALGQWPMSYEAQVREGYLNNADCPARGAVGGGRCGFCAACRHRDDAALALVKATSGGQACWKRSAAQLLLHGNGYVQLLDRARRIAV